MPPTHSPSSMPKSREGGKGGQLERATAQGKVQFYGASSLEARVTKTSSAVHSAWMHAEVVGIVTFDFVPFTFDDDANSSKTAVQEYQNSFFQRAFSACRATTQDSADRRISCPPAGGFKVEMYVQKPLQHWPRGGRIR